jgi:hypothetical protein
MLLLVVIVIGAAGYLIAKLMDGRAAAVTGVICWCVALATYRYAGTQHGLNGIFPTLGWFLFASLGLGFFVAAMTKKGPGEPHYAPLSEEDAKAIERLDARMKRLRALQESVPDYSESQPDQTKPGKTDSDQSPPPRKPDPPTPPT